MFALRGFMTHSAVHVCVNYSRQRTGAIIYLQFQFILLIASRSLLCTKSSREVIPLTWITSLQSTVFVSPPGNTMMAIFCDLIIGVFSCSWSIFRRRTRMHKAPTMASSTPTMIRSRMMTGLPKVEAWSTMIGGVVAEISVVDGASERACAKASVYTTV